MDFTTKIHINKCSYPIDYNSKIVSLGSCFAENMAEKFEYFKFQNVVNPFGIIFNPISIEQIVERAINNELYTEEDIFFHNERWHCFEVHSDLSDSNNETLLTNLNQILINVKKQLQEATHIIITYGTSWVYRDIKSNNIVANCHKVPQNLFKKEILPVVTIEKSIQNTINLIRKSNPNCHFIFTISPVRHIKDGFIENQLSKAHLITALQDVLGLEISNIDYFPSYEIMMDELRDYRFYAKDMLHPNEIAIDYIFEQFLLTRIKEEILPVMSDVCSVQKGLAHRPFNPNSKGHQQFLSKLQDKIELIQKQFPQIHF